MTDINALLSFLAVAETGSAARAARERNYSRQAVSQHVASLERLVGASLFVRDSSGMHLTDEGRALRQPAHALADALSRHPANRDEFVIELTHAALRCDLLRPIRDFVRASDASSIVRSGGSDAIDRVRTAQSNVTVGSPGRRDGLLHQHLCDAPLVAVVGADHPLADRSRVTAAELEEFRPDVATWIDVPDLSGGERCRPTTPADAETRAAIDGRCVVDVAAETIATTDALIHQVPITGLAPVPLTVGFREPTERIGRLIDTLRAAIRPPR